MDRLKSRIIKSRIPIKILFLLLDLPVIILLCPAVTAAVN